MRHEDREIACIGDLIAGLRETARGSLTWYRGHSRADWPLIPSVARSAQFLAAELVTMKRFKQNAMPYLPARPENDWEWVFLMQHYRAPTRLLDWSESPLVGLYFALADLENDDGPAALWCLDPMALNQLAGHNRAHALDVLAFGADSTLDDYLPERVNERVARLNPVAAIGPRNSPRMFAQSGTFTVIHAEATPVEAVGAGDHVWRYIINPDRKAAFREELKILYVNEHSLFPDLDRVALLAKELVQ